MSTSRIFRNNELIINYHDAVIYGWELNLVERRTEWLNDSCIHFFFTLLQQHHPSLNRPSSFLFMDPSVVSFWMHQCVDQDEIEDFVNSTQFPGKGGEERGGTIFIAINDKMSTNASVLDDNGWQVSGGGSHWSLLVIEVDSRKAEGSSSTTRKNISFWHFDSIRNSGNSRAAEDVAAKIYSHVYPEASITTQSSSGGRMVHPAKTPQQQNGYDCGVHVLGAAKILSNYLSTTTTIPASDTNGCHPQDLEECLRKEMGDSLQDFCSKLRDEISSEIRRLHEQTNK